MQQTCSVLIQLKKYRWTDIWQIVLTNPHKWSITKPPIFSVYSCTCLHTCSTGVCKKVYCHVYLFSVTELALSELMSLLLCRISKTLGEDETDWCGSETCLLSTVTGPWVYYNDGGRIEEGPQMCFNATLGFLFSGGFLYDTYADMGTNYGK